MMPVWPLTKTPMIEHRESKQWPDLIRKPGIALANQTIPGQWSVGHQSDEYGVAAVLTVQNSCIRVLVYIWRLQHSSYFQRGRHLSEKMKKLFQFELWRIELWQFTSVLTLKEIIVAATSKEVQYLWKLLRTSYGNNSCGSCLRRKRDRMQEEFRREKPVQCGVWRRTARADSANWILSTTDSRARQC
jgi:hypothetical protein